MYNLIKNCMLFTSVLINSYLIFAYDVKFLSVATGLSEQETAIWIDKLQGVTNANERGAFYYAVFPRLINKHDLKIGCEVGVSTGGHSYTILRDTNVKKLYSIDPYSHIIEPYFTSKVFDLFFLRTKIRLSEFGDRSEMIRMCSPQVTDMFRDEALDFVFIDADHNYEAVKKDVTAWYKKIRSGGIIGGDDYATVWPGVPQAINEFFNTLGITVNVDQQEPRVWWVQKP